MGGAAGYLPLVNMELRACCCLALARFSESIPIYQSPFVDTRHNLGSAVLQAKVHYCCPVLLNHHNTSFWIMAILATSFPRSHQRRSQTLKSAPSVPFSFHTSNSPDIAWGNRVHDLPHVHIVDICYPASAPVTPTQTLVSAIFHGRNPSSSYLFAPLLCLFIHLLCFCCFSGCLSAWLEALMDKGCV